ncbi:MAG: AAA family ATPase [Microcystaceae cyanobacterium]
MLKNVFFTGRINLSMIQRLYVNNFRCLENFELVLKEIPSSLLIGKNGTGKSTISFVLEIFQSIGRGINRIGELVQSKDFYQGRTDLPMRFEIEVILNNQLYKYVLALELPENFKKLRILEEQLLCEENLIYSRKEAQITLYDKLGETRSQFLVDWHLISLTIIQEYSEKDPIGIFKHWLAHIIILSPIPSLMTGNSYGETLQAKRDGSNLAEWFSGLLNRYPAAYATIDQYLRQVIPDLKDIYNDSIGKDAKSMVVRFETNNANLSINFEDLSDGEKCFFLCAVVIAANEYYGPLFCFWDEPDNYLSLSEVQHFVTSLRRLFKNKGQLLATSHNGEAILSFSYENTFFLDRKSHLEPTLIRLLSDLSVEGDLITNLSLGDLEL